MPNILNRIRSKDTPTLSWRDTRRNDNQNKQEPRKPTIVDPVRYKTVMCQNWAKCGSCPYSWKCQFAHGEKELRVRKTPQPTTPTMSPISSRRSSCSEIPSPVSSPVSLPPGLNVTPPGQAQRASSPLDLNLCEALEPEVCQEVSEELDESEMQARHQQLAMDLESERRRLRASSLTKSTTLPLCTEEASRAKSAKVTFAQVDFVVQGGVAERFSRDLPAKSGSFVPDHVKALWLDEKSCDSPLKCNPRTGKVEATDAADAPRPPWLVRRMSSAGLLVRRAVSFVLEESSTRSQQARLSRQRSRTSARSRDSLADSE